MLASNPGKEAVTTWLRRLHASNRLYHGHYMKAAGFSPILLQCTSLLCGQMSWPGSAQPNVSMLCLHGIGVGCRLVVTLCVQANVTIEEVLTWKSADRKVEQPHCLLVEQSESRIGAKRDIIVPRLSNVRTCPMSLMAVMTVSRGMIGGRTSITELIKAGYASKMYLIHDPDNPLKPITPNNIKRQLVKALAKISISVQPYEVQSLLSATRTNCEVKAYNTQVTLMLIVRLNMLMRHVPCITELDCHCHVQIGSVG